MLREPARTEVGGSFRRAAPAPDTTLSILAIVMRFIGLLLLVLANSAAPSAQQRFVEACVASSSDKPLEGVDIRSVCTCGAEWAISRGISGVSLDALTEYVGADGNLKLDTAPEPVQALSEIVIEGLFACIFDSIQGTTQTGAATANSTPAPRATPPRRAALMQPSSRVKRSGAGSTIRIQ